MGMPMRVPVAIAESNDDDTVELPLASSSSTPSAASASGTPLVGRCPPHARRPSNILSSLKVRVNPDEFKDIRAWKPREFTKTETAAAQDQTVVFSKQTFDSKAGYKKQTESTDADSRRSSTDSQQGDETVCLQSAVSSHHASSKNDDTVEMAFDGGVKPVARSPEEPMEDTVAFSRATAAEATDSMDEDTVMFAHPKSKSSRPSPPAVVPVASPPAATSLQDFGFVDDKKIITVNGKPYLKLEEIGRGGSSKVFKVLGTDSQMYALKRIDITGDSAETIESYTNEIALLEQLKGSRHIIQLIDSEVDLDKKAIHVVMEKGEIDLNQMLQKLRTEGNLNENFVRVTWQQMLQAVDAIHECRIVHSDLKPANFLFVNGTLKLIDFGIAKSMADDTANISRDSQVGTLNYMSPEAILDTSQRDDIDAVSSADGKTSVLKLGRPSDVWSLGCILYQMAHGKTPFADMNVIQKLQHITDKRHKISFPPLRNTALSETIQHCLQRDPRCRPTISGGAGLLTDAFLEPTSPAPSGKAFLSCCVSPAYPNFAHAVSSCSCSEEQMLSLLKQVTRVAATNPQVSCQSENLLAMTKVSLAIPCHFVGRNL
jgi:serine/threonine protein kinase